MNSWVLHRLGWRLVLVSALALAGLTLVWCNNLGEKHLRVVEPGRLIRGAWQSPEALRRIVTRERIKTIVTLTAINRDDPKYVSQANVVADTGVHWVLIPMRGSTATVEQMAQAADLLADADRQPIFFHCVAGHHRSSLAHAAYLIRHRGWSAARAWNEVSNLPWARPNTKADLNDQALIEEFARVERTLKPPGRPLMSEVHDDDPVSLAADCSMAHATGRGDRRLGGAVHRLESGQSQYRAGAARTNLPVGPNARVGARGRS